MEKYVLGIDNGGTVIKAALFDLDGKEIAVASRQTATLNPRPGYTERDMDELWEQNCACIRQVLADSGINPKAVAAAAVCGHGKGLYPWGKNGKPAYNGIISTDNRAWKYPDKWMRRYRKGSGVPCGLTSQGVQTWHISGSPLRPGPCQFFRNYTNSMAFGSKVICCGILVL